METLWSMSTTVREAERIVGFLKTACELEGQVWNKQTQCNFQILLIKNRQYLNDPDNTQSFNKLNAEQSRILKDKSIEMSFEEAKGIFEAKKYEDPPMRGRQSMAPLRKLGLVYFSGEGKDKVLTITDAGRRLAAEEIDFKDFMLDSLLKFQYPNPCEDGFKNWNTKPFINTLRLIKKVDELCEAQGKKAKGISTLEFGIFALSLKRYDDVNDCANRILSFREEYENIADEDEKEHFKNEYISNYLSEFQKPEKNIKEYTDNMIRYIRLTKYIYIRGKYSNTYIDLEPRRMTEINSILENDDGKAERFTEEEWINYLGTFGSYELPFETIPKLKGILGEVNAEVKRMERGLGVEESVELVPETKDELKEIIEQRRAYRTDLQNLEIKKAYHEDVNKIDEAIDALENILQRNKKNLQKKFSIELEKWSNVALNIINDSLSIKPNAPVGDDNEPIFTAPNGVPDIECYYETFNAVCEATMLTSRDQWYNEGQPVMRHLRQFEKANEDKPNYCLFVAPSLHIDTVNTFYTSVKYEYEGTPQKIVPITIRQLESLLKIVKDLMQNGKKFSHTSLKKFYDSCTDTSVLKSSTEWSAVVEHSIEQMREELIA